MSTVPVLLIPVSALQYREVVSPPEIAGAVLAVLGVAVLAQWDFGCNIDAGLDGGLVANAKPPRGKA